MIEKANFVLVDTTCAHVYLSPQGLIWKVWPILVNFGARKNGSNDFLQTWYQPSLGRGLPFDTLGHPVKILLWPLGGPQKCELLNRLSDFDEFFF